MKNVIKNDICPISFHLQDLVNSSGVDKYLVCNCIQSTKPLPYFYSILLLIFILLLGARSTLISTVKQTIISLDNLLPSSLMHINWSVLRKPWLNQVNSCSTPKDFARVMVVLMSCIKPVVYAPVWHEQLGKNYIYVFI